MTPHHAYHDSPLIWKDLLAAGLAEDGAPWDWASEGSMKNVGQSIDAHVIAKSEGVWVGDGLSQAAMQLAPSLKISSELRNGAALKTGQVVCRIRGSQRELLALERPFLNLASYAGGIARQTRGLVDLVSRACPQKTPRVTPTRKTLPQYREIAILSVLCGGGFSHRVSLSGGVLIKENHIASAGGIARAISGARAVSPHLLKIEIEVGNEGELREAISGGADGVLLDNFTPGQVRAALKIVSAARSKPFVEVSGGIDAGNISSYALEGVDVISVGSLTHSVRSIDLSLLVDA